MALALIARLPRSLTAKQTRLSLFLGILIVLVAGVSVFEALFSDTMDVHSMATFMALLLLRCSRTRPGLPFILLLDRGQLRTGRVPDHPLQRKGSAPWRHRVLAIQGLALGVLLIAFLALVAHLFDARDLYVGKSGLGMSLRLALASFS